MHNRSHHRNVEVVIHREVRIHIVLLRRRAASHRVWVLARCGGMIVALKSFPDVFDRYIQHLREVRTVLGGTHQTTRGVVLDVPVHLCR